MQLETYLLQIFGAAAVVNGLFSLFFINSNQSIPRESILFLNLLIVSLILKVSFSFVINEYAPYSVLTNTIRYASFYAYMCFGPLLYLYYINLLNKSSKANLWHYFYFISPLILLIVFEDIRNLLYYLQAYNFAFLVAIFFYIKRELYQKSEHIVNKKWGTSLFVGFIIIWLSANLLLIDFAFYFIELTILLFLSFYFLIYYVSAVYWARKANVQVLKKKDYATKKSIHLEVINKAKNTLEFTKVYKNSDLNLPKLANLIDVSTHQLSEAINVEMNMNFNEFINIIRIEVIRDAILDNTNYTIATIAYENGFNSISTFNTNFKKITKYTPSQYIKNKKL